MTKTIFIIAGEESGDALGAGLMQAIAERSKEPVRFIGIGGDKMESQKGFKSLLPMDELSVMGIWEVIWQLPRFWKLINGVIEEIHKAQPDMVITVDSQEFSYQVASRLKKAGQFSGKLVHYVAPTVWAWRPGRAVKLAQVYDELLCLFPFEADYFKPHGLNTTFVGHPMVGYGLEKADGGSFRAASHIKPDDKVLGLFFGSREEEIKKMAKPFMETVSVIKEQHPDIKIVVPTTKKMEYNVLQVLRAYECHAYVVTKSDIKYNAFAACDVALAVSGTVGLELSYMGIPHVIAYKTHSMTWLAVKYLVKVQHAHLANILLDKTVVPEFLQMNCEGLKIAPGILKLLQNDKARAAQKTAFKNLRALLGAGDALTPSEKAADVVLGALG